MNVFFQVGTITRPRAVPTDVFSGPGLLLQTFFTALIAFGGVYGVINLILAGYAFLSAGSDPKKIEAAWGKIWQTAIGLTFMAGSFLIAAILGKLIFGGTTSLLTPTIPTIF